MSDREKHKVVLPIGPQHPSLKEPGSFKITLDGEKVERAVVEAHGGEAEIDTELRRTTQHEILDRGIRRARRLK